MLSSLILQMVLSSHKVFRRVKSFFPRKGNNNTRRTAVSPAGSSEKYRGLTSEHVRFSSVICELFSVTCVHREVRADGLSVDVRVYGDLRLQHRCHRTEPSLCLPSFLPPALGWHKRVCGAAVNHVERLGLL